jgi:cyanophycin synthetase
MSDERVSIDELIARGEAMEHVDDDGAIAFFADLAERYPDDARVIFAYAGAFDSAGQEANAVAPYRRARALGLPDDELRRWYVQFGSTLRNVEAYEEAIAVLTEGHARFPDDVAIACFLALAQHSGGDPGRALQTVLEAVVAEAAAGRVDIRHYGRALGWYAKDLTGDAEG